MNLAPPQCDRDTHSIQQQTEHVLEVCVRVDRVYALTWRAGGCGGGGSRASEQGTRACMPPRTHRCIAVGVECTFPLWCCTVRSCRMLLSWDAACWGGSEKCVRVSVFYTERRLRHGTDSDTAAHGWCRRKSE